MRLVEEGSETTAGAANSAIGQPPFEVVRREPIEILPGGCGAVQLSNQPVCP